MHVELVDYTPSPEEKIGLFASICYDSKTDRDSCIRRAKSCVSKGHLATLRFAYATFRVSGISRACSHQLVRSKHLDYLQESQRYVEFTEDSFVIPNTKVDLLREYDEHYKQSLALYKHLLDNGVKKEDARYVLPNAATTQLYVTGNFQAWSDFINLRSGPEVQWEIRQVAQEIERQLSLIAPNVFELGESNAT
jgi:thymidylate synthase (FAD)